MCLTKALVGIPRLVANIYHRVPVFHIGSDASEDSSWIMILSISQVGEGWNSILAVNHFECALTGYQDLHHLQAE